MKQTTTCQFCKKFITLDIDDAYAALGDPLKLIKLASCNACADNKTLRNQLLDKIKGCVLDIEAKPTPEEMVEIRAKLTRVCQSYLKAVCEWLRVDYCDWDSNVVEQIIERPDTVNEVVRMMWRMAKTQSVRTTQSELV